jgi:hypothetical protein
MSQESTFVALQVMVEVSPCFTRAGAALIEAVGTRTVTDVLFVYDEFAGQVTA